MIANKIKILRENKGLSQKALADKLGITRSSVNAWEQGISVPSTQYILELANLFEVSTDYLLNFKNDNAINIDGLNDKEVKIILDNEKDFLRKALSRARKKLEKEELFYYLGKKYDIIKVPFDNIEIDDGKIYVKDDKMLLNWLKKEIKRIFTERLMYNYDLFDEDIPFPKLKIRSMKTRWGVCNRRDNSVTLNSKLIEYSLHEIDYVIIHELSHFVHFDHSREFWETVRLHMPDYKKAVAILKE